MSDPFSEVVIAASDLRMTAHREFDAFVQAIKALEARLGDELGAAEPNVIFPTQGKFQIVKQLRMKLETCMQLRERMIQQR